MPTSHGEEAGIWRSWGRLLADAARAVRAGGVRLIGLILLFQFALIIIVSPLIGWLFREALRAGGMVALDFGTLRLGAGFTVSLALIIVICAIAFWVAVLQFALIVIMLHRSHLGLALNAREVVRDLGRITRKLLRPSSLPLLLYLFVLVPLSGFGFTSVLAQGISVPPFISGELMKETTSAIVWVAFIVVLVLLNIRFALTLPVFVLTRATGGRSMRMSWRITRNRFVVSLVGAVVTVLVVAGIVTVALMVAALTPTAIADETAPATAPIVAAFSLGAAQALGVVLTSLVTAFVAAILVAYLSRCQHRLPDDLRVDVPEAGRPPRLGNRAIASLFGAAVVIGALVFGAAAIPTMQRLSQHPDTLVLAHRGFSDGGVENTMCGLEAAAAVGADLVEMDVMQTKDGKFVAMHDANLMRLAGVDARVKDLALDEITALTVHAAGHQCAVPSFADYVVRAAELELPLLIEIKLGGLDTPDHVELLIDELESLDLLENNIYHSLDAPSVATLKRLRPDLAVGYTMPFAAVDVPDTPADFIVVEEWSATEEMQRAAENAGLGFMVWTVNEEPKMREHLRRDTHGIITDHPDITLAAREEMRDESGLSDVLIDALTRFVVVF